MRRYEDQFKRQVKRKYGTGAKSIRRGKGCKEVAEYENKVRRAADSSPSFSIGDSDRKEMNDGKGKKKRILLPELRA